MGLPWAGISAVSTQPDRYSQVSALPIPHLWTKIVCGEPLQSWQVFPARHTPPTCRVLAMLQHADAAFNEFYKPRCGICDVTVRFFCWWLNNYHVQTNCQYGINKLNSHDDCGRSIEESNFYESEVAKVSCSYKDLCRFMNVNLLHASVLVTAASSISAEANSPFWQQQIEWQDMARSFTCSEIPEWQAARGRIGEWMGGKRCWLALHQRQYSLCVIVVMLILITSPLTTQAVDTIWYSKEQREYNCFMLPWCDE